MPNLKILSFAQFHLGTNHVVRLVVGNTGPGPSKAIDPGLYVDAIRPNPPAGQNEIRIQNSHPLPKLAPHTSVVVHSVFSTAKLNQKQVTRFNVNVDLGALEREQVVRLARLRDLELRAAGFPLVTPVTRLGVSAVRGSCRFRLRNPNPTNKELTRDCEAADEAGEG